MNILIISFIFIFVCVCISLFLIKPNSTTNSNDKYECKGNKCITMCGENEIMVQNKCECKDGFQRNGNKCISMCGDNEIMIQNKCECKDGFQRNGNKCISMCGENEIMIQNKCECKDGFQRDGNKCITTLKCNGNEIMVQNKCECKDGFQRDKNNRCLPEFTLVAKFTNGQIYDFDPIIIKGVGIIYVNERGLYLEESLIKGLETFSYSSSGSSIMLCDSKGIIYFNQQLDKDKWTTFDAKEKSYCGFSPSYKIRMIVTLSGIVYKNEKIITKLPLSSEHIIGISVDFSGDYQIIITSNANIYTSINGGEHWQLGGISSQLSQLLIPLKTLKTSSKFKSDFYVLSVEHLIKLHIKENGAIQIEEIPNKNNIISFDIISPDRLVCLGNNKIYLCINNVMFYLSDVPYSEFDFDKILYNENKIYVYNNFGIYRESQKSIIL